MTYKLTKKNGDVSLLPSQNYLPSNRLLDEDGQPMGTTGTALDTAAQDQDTPDISLFLGQELDTLTLDGNISIDDEAFDITTTGATPVVGNFVMLQEGVSFMQSEIIAVTPIAGNQYTLGLDIPVDFDFTTACAGFLQNVNMAINGLAVDKEFFLSPSGLVDGQKRDINRMIVSMTMTSAGDDGLFGNRARLVNGCFFRTENGIDHNMFVAHENSDFALEGFDVVYPIRSGGGGTFGMRSRITFNGTDKRGVVKRLVSTTNDKFITKVRDDLSTITSYRIKLQGQIVE